MCRCLLNERLRVYVICEMLLLLDGCLVIVCCVSYVSCPFMCRSLFCLFVVVCLLYLFGCLCVRRRFLFGSC